MLNLINSLWVIRLIIAILLFLCFPNRIFALNADTDMPTTILSSDTQLSPSSAIVDEEPSGGAKGRQLFFSQESLENTLPAGMQAEYMPSGSQSEIELEGSELRRKTNLPDNIKNKTVEEAPKPTNNIFENIRDWFLGLFLSNTTGENGFTQSTRPNDLPFTGQADAKKQNAPTQETYESAVKDTESFFTPEGSSNTNFPFSIPSSAVKIESELLKNLFVKISQDQCVPVGILLAFSQRESTKTFEFTDKEFIRYTTNNWQNNMTKGEINRTSCFNTCAGNKNCPNDDVRGPMQFNLSTWKEYIKPIKVYLKEKYNIPLDTYEPHRCNLRDSIIGAALKMKGVPKPEKDCTNWSKPTVFKVAENYCGAGACNNHAACGVNYCEDIWSKYNNYQIPNKN